MFYSLQYWHLSQSAGFFAASWLDPANLWSATKGVAGDSLLPWCLAAVILIGGMLSWLAPARRKRIKAAVILFVLAIMAALLAIVLRSAA